MAVNRPDLFHITGTIIGTQYEVDAVERALNEHRLRCKSSVAYKVIPFGVGDALFVICDGPVDTGFNCGFKRDVSDYEMI